MKTQSQTPVKDSAIVLSGGLDSTTLLYEECERIAVAITFCYGSNHNARELACARRHCQALDIEHVVIDLGFIKEFFNSSLTSGADAIPDGNYNDENMHSTVVPFRNGIMLAAACGLAESRGLKRVLIANHGGDHAIYPDCRPAFVEAMNAAMQAGTYAQVELCAPYTNISKSQIVARGAALGIDYADTYSCYRGGDLHCGRCATCRERHEAFEQAGVADPTTYECIPQTSGNQ
ncbi:MAG: 7-cyano-7-deazaguanine synthase QueC [Bacteroidales bacterium]|nr:7-cyano-7-deazaguanine synthase QueC [Bacteroidales bacterium]